MNGGILHKFDENLKMVLKANSEELVHVFHRVTSELGREGSEYSINRESFVKFFNELNEPQQKEFLSLVAQPQNQGRNVYDVACDYMVLLLKARH